MHFLPGKVTFHETTVNRFLLCPRASLPAMYIKWTVCHSVLNVSSCRIARYCNSCGLLRVASSVMLSICQCVSSCVFVVCAVSLPTPTVVAVVRFSPVLSVCLSVYPHDISNTDAARITSLKCSTFSPGNPYLFWGHKVKVVRCRRGSVHSCECWLLLVNVT